MDSPPPVAATYARSAWLFRRLLGLVYLVAFWSLARQILGLVGHDGILPAATYMDGARVWAEAGDVGLDRFRVLPTLFWITSSDAFLEGVCLGGTALAALVVIGVAPIVLFPMLWLAYLSLSVVGQDFLGYQWDALLLETGFLAIFMTPAGWRDRWRSAVDPPTWSRWLLWWLIVRLMEGSGAIKLASGDPTWRNLDALTFHYETQPIPTPLAWYAHQLPRWFQEFTTAVTLGVELIVPTFIFGRRQLRTMACVILALLQVSIALTGNYAFFNLLSLALLVLLVDDETFAKRARLNIPRLPAAAPSWPRVAALALAAAIMLPVSVLEFGRSLGVDLAGVPPLGTMARLIGPLRSVNSYGLFAVMTTTRPEIVVEGSNDGVTWQAYEFSYKAGDLRRRPPSVAPLQPRLDWQMWLAALGDYDGEPWLAAFLERLLDASPHVLGLLERDPFSEKPPRYVRASRLQYRFARRDGGGSGAWWTSERLGAYSPVLSLR